MTDERETTTPDATRRRQRLELPQSIFIAERMGAKPFDPETDRPPRLPPMWLVRLLGHAE